jgi:GH15 family glucan-1,4-alpha-glucosidase
MDLLEKSIQIIKNNQSKYGSYIACPNFPVYRYCWLRDGSFIAFSMDIAEEYESSYRFHSWIHQTINRYAWKVKYLLSIKGVNNFYIHPNNYLHARYNLDGTESNDEWGNKQFDGYGIWLWSLTEHIKKTNNEYLIDKFKREIDLIIDYLMRFWKEPCYSCWEEHPDKIHTSTIACIAGGLKAINQYIKCKDIDKKILEMEKFIKEKCVLEERFAKFYDPSENQAKSIDSSLIWLVYPFQFISKNDPIFLKTIKEIEKKLVNNGVHRYPEDTYYGGGEWIILTLWLAWYYYDNGKKTKGDKLLKWVESTANEYGELPEQNPKNLLAPNYYPRWVERWGPIARPLLWSHAMYIIVKKKFE